MDRTHAEQLERKQDWVQRTVNHSVDVVIPSPRSMAYRARIRLVPDDRGRLGYHPPRSHDVLAIDNCAVAREEINRALAASPSVPGSVDHVEFRSDGERVVVALDTAVRRRERVFSWASALDADAFDGAAVALNGQTIRGDTKVTLCVEGIEHRLSAATFYQVNLEINQRLVSDVVRAVQERQPTSVLDAYAGAGNLSLPLVVQGMTVIQIESHPNAVADGKATAKRLGLDVDVRRQRLEDFQPGDAFFDLAIVDPPRAGAGALMPRLLMTRPATVIMVSCHPSSLARDVFRASQEGYRLSSLRMYDMFPQTDHVECMGVLERS